MNETKDEHIVEEDLNDILRVRREKLADLCNRDKDPFKVTEFCPTHRSMTIINEFESLEDHEVT
ncbi:MAG: lysine--tRNA ligase, partial [Clostridiales bacterium]|nr:lysine--tRNA ligase [Clostridiales bacterium]